MRAGVWGSGGFGVAMTWVWSPVCNRLCGELMGWVPGFWNLRGSARRVQVSRTFRSQRERWVHARTNSLQKGRKMWRVAGQGVGDRRTTFLLFDFPRDRNG